LNFALIKNESAASWLLVLILSASERADAIQFELKTAAEVGRTQRYEPSGAHRIRFYGSFVFAVR
jgi:hypothetical protein